MSQQMTSASFRRLIQLTACGCLMISLDLPAHATSYTISVFSDDFTNNGNCTLREAIHSAMTDSSRDACPAGTASDSITLLAGTYTFNLGDYSSVSSQDVDLLITGQGSGTTVISMGFQNRFLDLSSGGNNTTLTLECLSLALGRVTGSSAVPEHGGALRLAGYNLLVNDVQFTLSSTVSDGDGGAVYFRNNSETPKFLTILDSAFESNTAADGGGGLFVDGEQLDIEIRATRFAENTARFSGGFSVSAIDSNGILDGIEVVENEATNSASGAGGQIFSISDLQQSFTVRRSVFRDNLSGLSLPPSGLAGTGLFFYGDETQFTLESSVFSGNRTTSTLANRESE